MAWCFSDPPRRCVFKSPNSNGNSAGKFWGKHRLWGKHWKTHSLLVFIRSGNLKAVKEKWPYNQLVIAQHIFRLLVSGDVPRSRSPEPYWASVPTSGGRASRAHPDTLVWVAWRKNNCLFYLFPTYLSFIAFLSTKLFAVYQFPAVYGGFHSHGATPIAGGFTRANPTKMDEHYRGTPMTQETTISVLFLACGLGHPTRQPPNLRWGSR